MVPELVHFQTPSTSFNRCVNFSLPQGASRTAEDGERERREGKEGDERIGRGPRGGAAQALPPGPNPPAAVRVRNGPDAAASNPASRGVQQSGKSYTRQEIAV